MTLPTVTVRARLSNQSGTPIAGAKLVAVLTRAEVYDGIVVPARQSARSNGQGIAELALFPNDLGVAGSAYEIAAYDAGGRLLYQTRAVFPASDEPLSLHAFADNPAAAPISLTDQQLRDVREARAGIDAARQQVADDRDAVAGLHDETQDLRDEAASKRDAVAADRIATSQQRGLAETAAGTATQQAGIATGAAESASHDAEQTAADRQQTGEDRAAAIEAAGRAKTAAEQLEQLIIENNALRATVEYHHGRPLLRNGERF